MQAGTRSIFVEGARLVVRRHRVLWGIYALSLVLGGFGALPVLARASRVLSDSLAAGHLVGRFDLVVFGELWNHPGGGLGAQTPASLLFAFLFAAAMLFLGGGILEAYRRDARLPLSEFFAACGTFFLPFVRLLIVLGILLGLGAIPAVPLQSWSSRLSSDSPREMLGFWVWAIGNLIFVLLFLTVRLWFDMAQVYAVAENERRIRRTLPRAFRLTFGNFGRLFSAYLGAGIVGLGAVAVVGWVWLRFVRPEWVGVTFLLTQVAVLLMVATRLWQRASQTAWYAEYQQALVVAAPAEMPPAVEVSAVEPPPEAPAVEPAPPLESAPSPPAEPAEAPAEAIAEPAPEPARTPDVPSQ